MAKVYVLDINGYPLMPTTRYGKVRRLLKNKQAVVVNLRPFTIRLLYETENITQELALGIDPGRKNIGLSVINSKGECLYAAKAETVNKRVPKHMSDRKAFRMSKRQHRREKKRRRAVAAHTDRGVFERILPGTKEAITCHDIRNKESRFNNRRRPEKWLTPTARHLLDTHLELIQKVRSILPITDICLETNRFAFMKLENPEIYGIDYQKGPLEGYDDVYAAVAEQQHGHCILCKNRIGHYHHIIPGSKGGADTIENLAGLCLSCHDRVHKSTEAMKELKSIKAGLNKKYHHLSILNQIIPHLTEAIERMPGITLHTAEGYETALTRVLSGFDKDHDVDAYMIACNGIGTEPAEWMPESYTIRQFRNHDRAARHIDNADRVYLLDGKAVAVNRHKASTQTKDSLEEFRKTHTESEISRLTVKPHGPQYKQRHEYMPGSVFLHHGKRYILQRYDGAHANKDGVRRSDYCVDAKGIKHPYKQVMFVAYNDGLIYI